MSQASHPDSVPTPAPGDGRQFGNVFVGGAVGAGKAALTRDLISAFRQAAGDSASSSFQDGS
ncbi:MULTISPECIES: hypothetical protein [Burkholderia]|uniref:hypothetical protein n=1 Tax=Burkholderia TaxID=32008 RepID=UPI000F5454D0|nr:MULTISPECIES: hypothetical protein [Burkholderia]MDN7429155.1 hypothetical protein [Burkholderia sp. AU45388]MDN7500000.1 hypothetical protein [Burkholderia gladioli]